MYPFATQQRLANRSKTARQRQKKVPPVGGGTFLLNLLLTDYFINTIFRTSWNSLPVARDCAWSR